MKNKTLDTIHSLRSVRLFEDRRITEETMNAILDAAVRAATASHRQSYLIMDIDDREYIKKLFGNNGDRMLLFCVDTSRLKKIADRLNGTFDNKYMMEYFAGTIDTVLAAQTAVIAARSMGIDSVIHHALQIKDMDALYEKLQLPESLCFPVMAIVMGYAKKEPEIKKGRLTGEGVVFRNVYHMDDEMTDRIIARYDIKEDHMGYISDWESKGYEHYMNWFLEVWNNHGSLEETTSEYFKMLEKRGFCQKEHFPK